MKRIFAILSFLAILSSCNQGGHNKVTSYVDPFIGTDGHGHTYPGAAYPSGLVQLSPDTRKDSWDGCSGYHYSDNTIMGFSHTHLSGTGVGDYGDIRFMPFNGKIHLQPGDASHPEDGYRSRFSHEEENASPGYYNVLLEDYNIQAELTVSQRCGFHKYTFPEGQDSYILIDLLESVTSDRIIELYIEKVSDTEIAGFRRTDGWAKNQLIHFYAKFSEAFDELDLYADDAIVESSSVSAKNVKALAKFQPKNSEEILVKVGLSAVSMEGAKANLDAEIPKWNFDRIIKQAKSAWKNELSRVIVADDNKEDLVSFYTALYHAFLAPNIFSDTDGRYRGHDSKVHQAEGFNMYTVFSLWDTYRTAHPLYNLLQPSRNLDFIKSMLQIYKDGGLLPVWELAGNETFCMIGYHSIPVITDAYIKGITDFDAKLALEAMINSAEQDHFGLDSYRKYGFIPADMDGESVSKTLEYAYDDWCIAMFAESLGEEEVYKEFIQRAQYYKNIYDPATGFMRGKRNSMFVKPFDPAEVNFMLTEANTWQYNFYVPQDVSGLIGLLGGTEAFDAKLDEMFQAETGLAGRHQADITGLIGQYAHGNEPSHHMAYLYNYVGKPYKTQKLVRQIMDELYTDQPDGLCGNEDCGQMSAWYVMSAMGFYPVTPGTDIYILGSPLFKEMTFSLENGNEFSIKAEGNSNKNIYIQSAKLNDSIIDRSYLYHDEIVNGGSLELIMGPEPNKKWGRATESWPVSSITDHLITAVPYFDAVSLTFKDDLKVGLSHIYKDVELYYRNASPQQKTKPVHYHDSIHLFDSRKMGAVAYKDEQASKEIEAEFYKIPHEWAISIKNEYSLQYTAGGDNALIDHQFGGKNFRTGAWQGYHQLDLDVVIDLGRSRRINKVAVRFLEDQNSWIFLPEEVEIGISKNLYDFKTVLLRRNDISENNSAKIETITKDLRDGYGRYITVRAKNVGICPEWHKGSGEKAWIFVDEIIVE